MRQEKLSNIKQTIVDDLNTYGPSFLVEELTALYGQYMELAHLVTDGQYDDWTHNNLIKFIKDGEF